MKTKHINLLGKTICYMIAPVVLYSCTAPRAVTHSGKVTPLHELKVGYNYTVNVSTSTIGSVYGGIESATKSYINNDSVILNDQLKNINKAVVAYALDPIGTGYELYARYGVLKRVDVGYKYASGVHVFDGMYQFMGSTGTIDNPGPKGLYGSIGLQFSHQKYELPSWSGLDKVQHYLGFDFKRKDIMIPLVFSASFGKEEKIGNISFGLVYNHTFIKYGFDVKNIYGVLAENAAPELLNSVHDRKNFGSVGGFVNVKVGYKYAYFLASCATYYTNYGTFKMVGGGTAHYSGFTFVPTVGVQFRIPTKKVSKAIKDRIA